MKRNALKRKEKEREQRLDRYLDQERQFRRDQKRWNETMGKPHVGQTVAIWLRPRFYTAVLGTVVPMEERKWETENIRKRFSLNRHDIEYKNIWMIQIHRRDVESDEMGEWYNYRFCGDYAYFLMHKYELGEEWGTDIYVRHLRDQVRPAEYAQLILETYGMGESRAIFFKKRCRRGERCNDKRVGHLLNERH